MLRLFIFNFICVCVLIGNADARSRNPRSQDFEEASTLVNQDILDDYFDANITGVKRQRLEEAMGCSFASRITVENDIFSYYSCHWGRGPGGRTQKAYLNELDFARIRISTTATGVLIPCLADRECVFGNDEGYPKNEIYLHPFRLNTAKKLAELLKAN